MNELSNKVISLLTEQTNFLKNCRKGSVQNPLDIKLFNIVKEDTKHDKNNKNFSKSKSEVLKCIESLSGKISINQIIALPISHLG
jgi:hypothetical protein